MPDGPSEIPDDAPHYTPRQVAERWKVEVNFVYRMIDAGTLKVTKFSPRTYRCSMNDIRAAERKFAHPDQD